ncbi:MAG: SpoIIE family protein phosphatase [Microscillaceae bacterium]|nr:SpoIIE family protein phosphatase [Microscillaceae bacterium]
MGEQYQLMGDYAQALLHFKTIAGKEAEGRVVLWDSEMFEKCVEMKHYELARQYAERSVREVFDVQTYKSYVETYPFDLARAIPEIYAPLKSISEASVFYPVFLEVNARFDEIADYVHDLAHIYKLLGNMELSQEYYRAFAQIYEKLLDFLSQTREQYALPESVNVRLSQARKALRQVESELIYFDKIETERQLKQQEAALLEAKSERYRNIGEKAKQKASFFQKTASLNQKLMAEAESRKKALEEKNKALNAQKELLQKKKDLQSQTNLYLSAAIGLFLLLIVGLARSRQRYLRLSQSLEKSRQELDHRSKQQGAMLKVLEKQKNSLEMLQQESQSSLHYAQRIQRAILPRMHQIKAALPDSFIFFQPLEAVSGDFYWFTELEDKIILAAIDCTGHGVPGAFMSMLGDAYLHEIVKIREITRPDQILTELNFCIREALKSPETEVSDGMDAVIITIHREAGYLEFAGAKNPLYIVEKGQLTELRGSLMSIGTYAGQAVGPEGAFPLHRVPLTLSSVFYLCSDGYQDQFGGLEGRKFMKGKFKKLLLKAHRLSFYEQVKLLGKRFQTGKATTPRWTMSLLWAFAYPFEAFCGVYLFFKNSFFQVFVILGCLLRFLKKSV